MCTRAFNETTWSTDWEFLQPAGIYDISVWLRPANTNISASLFLPQLPLSALRTLTKVSKEIQGSGPGASPFSLLEKRNLPSYSVLPLNLQSISEAPRLYFPDISTFSLLNKVCGSFWVPSQAHSPTLNHGHKLPFAAAASFSSALVFLSAGGVTWGQ